MIQLNFDYDVILREPSQGKVRFKASLIYVFLCDCAGAVCAFSNV